MFIAKNLQYLRRRDKITQEELAEKLNVSRQSVSKWEMGEAYPETEKLLALCELFDVSLDGLMRNDLSEAEQSETSTVEFVQTVSEEIAAEEQVREVEPTQFAVYAKHMDKHSRAIAIGVTLILIGVAICIALSGFALTLSGFAAQVAEIMGGVSVILFVAIAVFLFVMFGQMHENFRKRNPLVSKPSDAVRKGFAAIMAALISGILLDVVFMIVMSSLIEAHVINVDNEEAAICYVTAAFMFVLAFIVGGIVYMGIQHSKYDLRKCAGENGDENPRRNKLSDTICGVIMMVATATYLLLGFIGDHWHPGWIVFPVGGILCGIVRLIFNVN